METALTGGAAGGYADSVDSSPRSRGGESWDEPIAAAVPNKLRLMCSYGGHIVPRPHDKSLCYLGGETRIVVVERHTTLADLSSKLSRSLLAGRPFSLKYQLPSEDLDSLISVTTDEDLDNMIEEYDRIVTGSSHANSGNSIKPSRLRLFLFPVKVESNSSSISSLLDDSKSETWFVDALNGAIVMGGGVLPRGLSADSTGSSVNCLLGLEDDTTAAVGAGAVPPLEPEQLYHPQVQQNRLDSPEKLAVGKQGQDIHSVPDSPMLDTSSSFGSASSAPILSNLPPIRVRPEDRGPDPRGLGGSGGGGGGGLEEHFAQMSVLGQKQEEGLKDGGFVAIHHNPSPSPVAFGNSGVGGGAVTSVAPVTTLVISPTENPNHGNRAFSSDEEKLEHGGVRKPQQQPQVMVVPQQKTSAFDLQIPQRTCYPERSAPGASELSIGSDGKQEGGQNAVQDSNYRVQMQQQPSEPSYLIPIQPEKFQQPQQQHQYVHANPQLVHHQSPSPVPFQSFYQMQPQMHSQQQLPQTHAYNQQIPMFFVPLQPNPNYGPPVQQSNMVDTVGMPPQGKPTLPIPNSVLQTQGVVTSAPKPELVAGTNMYRNSGPVVQPPHAPQFIHLTDQTHQQFMGYHPMQHHPSQSVAPAGYRYEFPNPVSTPQMYYTQTTSMPMPSHFQTVSSSAATMISDVPSQLQQADGKQTRASS